MKTHVYGTRTLDTMPAPGLPDHLVRVVGEIAAEGFGVLRCDDPGCFASEYDRIMLGTSPDLWPMYLDTRHDVMLCQGCVDAGRHLDDDTPSAKEEDP